MADEVFLTAPWIGLSEESSLQIAFVSLKRKIKAKFIESIDVQACPLQWDLQRLFVRFMITNLKEYCFLTSQSHCNPLKCMVLRGLLQLRPTLLATKVEPCQNKKTNIYSHI